MKKQIFMLAMTLMCMVCAAFPANAEETRTPVLTGSVNGENASMQLIFNLEDDTVSGWWMRADAPQVKRMLKGTYEGEGGILYCTIKLEEVNPDSLSLVFNGDYSYGYMMGAEMYGFEGTVNGVGESEGLEGTFSFENE